MADQPPDDNFEKELEAAADKLNVEIDYLRTIKPEELLYLLDHCPFLQIVNTVISEKEQPDFELVKAPNSGWDIHVYPDAMSSSPGRLLFGGYRWGDDEDDEDGGGFGTIYNQAFVTGMDMINLAQSLGWAGVQLVDGHPRMIRGAWIQAANNQFPFEGFEPTIQDLKVQQRVLTSPAEMETIRQKLKSGK